MKKYLSDGYNDIYRAIVFMYLTNFFDIINSNLNMNLPLFRYFFAMAGIFYFLKGISVTSRNFHLYSRSIKYSLYALVMVIMVMILRGMPVIWEGKSNYFNLKLFLSAQLFIYLIPIVVLSEPNEYLLKKLFKISYILAILYLLITIPLFGYFSTNMFNGAETFGVFFAAGASILLLTQFYHSTKVRWVVTTTFLLVLFINILFARRNQVVYFGSIIFFFILISILSKSYFAKKRKGAFIIGFTIIALVITVYVFYSTNQFTYFYEKSQTGMDSRQDAIEKFIMDFDAHPNDYIYGRGINGLIFAGYLGRADPVTGERSSIENGYLQHILVGGWIYLGLILLLSIRAMYLGFFRSHNLLSKAFASIVATYLIDMIGYGVPTLTLKYFMIWMGISVCYSARIRNYSDEYLKSIVGLK